MGLRRFLIDWGILKPLVHIQCRDVSHKITVHADHKVSAAVTFEWYYHHSPPYQQIIREVKVPVGDAAHVYWPIYLFYEGSGYELQRVHTS